MQYIWYNYCNHIRETMSEEEFLTMMNIGMQQVKNNESQDMEKY